MKKAVVIGGSGFIGSHVVDNLNTKGYDTYVFDTKISPWINNKQKMILGDIVDKKLLDKVLSKADIVFNFAGISDLNYALTNPLKTAEINIIGNLNILEACHKNKINRYIFASTVYVNGNQGGFYRCSKLACEKYIEEFQKTYDLKYTILRYGSLYGPRADLNNGINKIISKAIKEKKLVYEGHKDTTREYIHVFDAAEATVLAANKEFENNTFTLTGQQSIKVSDLLKLIAEIMNIPEEKTKIIKNKQIGHYIRTPHAQQIKFTKKLVPNSYIDLAEGISQIINELKEIGEC